MGINMGGKKCGVMVIKAICPECEMEGKYDKTREDLPEYQRYACINENCVNHTGGCDTIESGAE